MKRRVLSNKYYPTRAAFRVAFDAFFANLGNRKKESETLLTPKFHFIGAPANGIPWTFWCISVHGRGIPMPFERPSLSSGFLGPFPLIAEQGVGEEEKLAQDGGERDLRRFSCADE